MDADDLFCGLNSLNVKCLAIGIGGPQFSSEISASYIPNPRCRRGRTACIGKPRTARCGLNTNNHVALETGSGAYGVHPAREGCENYIQEDAGSGCRSSSAGARFIYRLNIRPIKPNTTKQAPATIIQCEYSIAESASVISPSTSARAQPGGGWLVRMSSRDPRPILRWSALQAVSHLVSDLSVALSLRHLMTPASLAGSVCRSSLRDPRPAGSR